jgi:hypothetical protein
MMLFRQLMFGLLALVIFAQQGSKALILFDYCLNKKYIATVLCENRNRPQMHCNGKCHLRKEMKKDDEHQGNEKQNLNEKQEFSYWENQSSAILNFNRPSEKISKPTKITAQLYSVLLSAPFHPPCE